MDSDDDLIIERASRTDVETITDQWVRLARDQRAYGSDVLAEPNRETMRETLAAYQFDDGLLVARVGGTLAGFASCSLERGSLQLGVVRGLLSNLYVDPGYRNRGVGTALLRAVEETLRTQGADAVTLETMTTNLAARRFYRREGYESHRVAMKRTLQPREENDTHSKEDA